MGHVRLGGLTRTRNWLQVIELLEGGADAASVATAGIGWDVCILFKTVSPVGAAMALPMTARVRVEQGYTVACGN